MKGSYRRVDLIAAGWRVRRVAVARTAWQRFVGLHRRGVAAVLLPVRSVHTLTLSTSIGVVAIDRAGVIIAERTLRPRRVAVFPAAVAVVEVSEEVALPRVGSLIRVVPSS